MKKDEIVEVLMQSAEDNGFLETVHAVFGGRVRISIAYSKKSSDTEIDAMDFSVRANNALKREGLFTLGEIIDLIMGEGLMRIRNLGKKTENEIKTRLLAFGYAQLSEADKRRFFYDLLEKNLPAAQ